MSRTRLGSRVLPVVVLVLAAAAARPAHSQDVPALEAKAKELFKSKAYVKPPGDNVVDVCKQIIAADPTNATAADLLNKVVGVLVSTGDQRLAKRDYRGAMGNFDQALQLDSSNARARAGKDKAREGMEREKFEVEPGKDPGYYLTKGNEMFDAGDYVRARKYYQAILKAMPDDPFAKKRVSECEKMLGMKEAAAPAPPPGDPTARLPYYREAAAHSEKAGEWDAAASYYKQILAAAPDDAAAKAGLERAEDHTMGYGRVRVAFAGAPFWWSAKVKDANEAQSELGITVKILVDGKEAATFTDRTIENLVLGEVSKNELHVPDGLSGRVTSPGNNTVALVISAGSDKPRTFSGQVTVPVGKGQVLDLTMEGNSTLKFGGGFSKKMGGDYTIVLKPGA